MRFDADIDEIKSDTHTLPLNMVPQGLKNGEKYFGRLVALVEISKKSDNRFFPTHQSYKLDYGTFDFYTAKFPINSGHLAVVFVLIFLVIGWCLCKKYSCILKLMRYRIFRHMFNEFDEDCVGSSIEIDILAEISMKKDMAARELAENLESLETLDEEKPSPPMPLTQQKETASTPSKSNQKSQQKSGRKGTPEKKVKQD